MKNPSSQPRPRPGRNRSRRNHGLDFSNAGIPRFAPRIPGFQAL
jgi:hypothetical protein